MLHFKLEIKLKAKLSFLNPSQYSSHYEGIHIILRAHLKILHEFDRSDDIWYMLPPCGNMLSKFDCN